MKAFLIPINPKWCMHIANGDKKIEIRGEALSKAIQKEIDKTGYAILYGYCTKNGGNLVINDLFQGKKYIICKGYKDFAMNGKVIFKFKCYKVDRMIIQYDVGWVCGDLRINDIEKLTCLNRFELYEYSKQKRIYGIHISELEIFDKPKELSEFYKVGHYEDLDDCFTDEKQINGKWCIPLKKAPQNYYYVELEE